MSINGSTDVDVASTTEKLSKEAQPVSSTMATETPEEQSTEEVSPANAMAVAGAELPPRSGLQTFLIMLAICVAVFLAAIDTVILTTALPTIASDFHASDSGFAWIGAAFLLANAASMPFWGKISDIFGRKPILLIANAVFLIGSLISALSKSLTMLLVGRAIQGLGAGGLSVLANVVVSDLFSQRQRGLYLSVIGTVWSFATAVGPVVGGAFAEKVSWRWCFWINLPCDGLSLVLLSLFLHVHTPRTPLIDGLKAIDWLGTLTVTGGTVMLLVGLEFGGVTFPWDSATVICLIIFGIFTLVIFLFTQWRFAKYPIMPLPIFTNRSNAATLAVVVAHGLAYISMAYFLPFYFQAALGYSPIMSGVWSLIMAVVMAMMTIGAGFFMVMTGKYLELIWFGFVFMTLGFGLFINFQPYRSTVRMVMFQIVVSLGVGPLFQAPLLALQANLKQEDIATGTATLGFLRMLAAGISVVVGQVIYQSDIQKKTGTFIAVGIPTTLANKLADGSSVSATFIIQGLTKAQQLVVKAAITNSLSKIWIFYTAVSFAGLVACLGIRKKTLSKTHTEAKTGLQNGNAVESELNEKRGEA
jgi:EmrB/QacA subfamily drug resistance transporter